MIPFLDDYSEGAHPTILNAIIETNLSPQKGYGEDEYSLKAKQLIKDKIKNQDAAIYFVSGGTQANILVIKSLLKSHEAVISASTGHIYGHEAGAIEHTGSRVISVETKNGKLTSKLIENVLNKHTMRPQSVVPKLVYVSNATELGTVYTKEEVKELYFFCKQRGLFLFMDGARLAQAITSSVSNLQFNDIAKYTDVFYLGGTKNGALCGEAIVFKNKDCVPHFDYILKQNGAMLAKGRLLGIQFQLLFQSNLLYELAAHANKCAVELSEYLQEKGYSFYVPTESNQLFLILPNNKLNEIKKKVLFHVWKPMNREKTIIRLVTSWATTPQHISAFKKLF